MPQEHVPFYNRINNVEYGGKHRYTAKYFISEVHKSKGLMCFQQKLKGLKKKLLSSSYNLAILCIEARK